MVNWAKKITKAVGEDIAIDEQVEAGVFVQPAGSARSIMSMQLGGVIGQVIADKLGSAAGGGEYEFVTDQGIAARIPTDEALVFGLTSRRLLVWGHSRMSGKPKGFKAEVPLSRVAGIEAEKQKLAHKMVILFNDGSGTLVEAPNLGKPEGFLATFHRLRG